MALSFLDSAFPTRAEYETAAALPIEERNAAECARAAQYNTHRMQLAWVGRVVQMHGLKARADLNGRRARAVKYDATTGRIGVALLTLNKFGGHERSMLALQSSNLTVIQATEADADNEMSDTVEETVSWEALCGKLGLRHLADIPWQQYEDKLFYCLAPKDPKDADVVGAERCLEGVVTSQQERNELIEALRAPASTYFGSLVAPSFLTIMSLLSARLEAARAKEDREMAERNREQLARTRGVPTADARYRTSMGRTSRQPRGRIDDHDIARPPLEKPKRVQLRKRCARTRAYSQMLRSARALTPLSRSAICWTIWRGQGSHLPHRDPGRRPHRLVE